MQVTGSSFTEKVYQYYQQNQQGRDTSSVTWRGMLSQAWGGALTEPEDPTQQILSDYEAWRAQQPPRNLPGSQGATEENKAYLREHYSGRLGLFERLDAADTMVEMGILSREQMLQSLGFGTLQRLTIDGRPPLILSVGPVDRDRRFDAWSNFFYNTPLMRADTLSLLFQELDSSLAFFGKKDDTAAEVRAVLGQLTHRVAA